MSLSRRCLIAGAPVLAVAAWGSSCRRNRDDDDPRPAALPGPADVDAKLSRLIPGARLPATIGDADPPTEKGADAPLVVIVAFSDFQCPVCATGSRALDELLLAYPEDLRVVFRQFPLPMHPRAEAAARASLAAARQRRFWAMHDHLFSGHAGDDDDALAAAARSLGLDDAAFARDLADPDIAARVQAEQSQGRSLGVRGTPTLVLNGLRIAGVPAPDAFAEVIDGERRVARALIEAGSRREDVYARFMRAAGAK